MTSAKKTTILTIDDEAVVRTTIRAYLEDYDYTVETAENGKVGLEIINKKHFDLVLVDLRMPEVDGLEVLSVLREKQPDLPIIVISGTGEIGDVVEALRLGAWDYLLKPITDMNILRHSIERSLERTRLIVENRLYQLNLEGLVNQKTIELEEINTRLRNVVESNKKLLRCGQLSESGSLILKEFGMHMDATGGSIYKVALDGLEHIASIDTGHAAPKINFPLEPGSVFHRVMNEKEPLFLQDIDHDPTLSSSGWGKYGDNSLLVFPITGVKDEIHAIISLHSKKVPPFNSQDRDIGKILASFASEALQIAKVSSALQNSEERLRQAQKMEAIGTLAGGIAHDFNNILAAIIGYTDLSLFSGSCDEVVRKNLVQVKNASNRAKDLVTQILSFSRTEEFGEEAVDIAPIIKEALKLLRATIPATIKIDTDIPEGLGKITTDPTKIYQVLMNLCTNAAHAMHANGGLMTIRFDRLDIDDAPDEVANSKYPSWLRLSISDTGVGIPKEDLERIFDPYFTTKEKGEGTGLGLAVVHGIVRSSGGFIKVESEHGKGSIFHLYFPYLQYGTATKDEIALAQMKGGDEKILFVDDESTLAAMAGEMLEKLGYSVQVLSSSKKALQMFRKSPYEYDLLITDQTMPDISGIDLALHTLRIRPDLPVILYTGYSASIDEDEVKNIGIREFLMKPLSMSVLADVVRRTLDG